MMPTGPAVCLAPKPAEELLLELSPVLVAVLVERVVPVWVLVAVRVVLSLETVLVSVPVVVPVLVDSTSLAETVETAMEVTEPALSVDSEKTVETALAAPEASEVTVETAMEVTDPALSVDSEKTVETAAAALKTVETATEVTEPALSVDSLNTVETAELEDPSEPDSEAVVVASEPEPAVMVAVGETVADCDVLESKLCVVAGGILTIVLATEIPETAIPALAQ